MSDNKNSFLNKLKDSKTNRAAVISSVLIVATLIAVIAVTVALNRSKKEELPPLDNGTKAPVTQTPEDTKAPVNEPADTEAPSGSVSDRKSTRLNSSHD